MRAIEKLALLVACWQGCILHRLLIFYAAYIEVQCTVVLYVHLSTFLHFANVSAARQHRVLVTLYSRVSRDI